VTRPCEPGASLGEVCGATATRCLEWVPDSARHSLRAEWPHADAETLYVCDECAATLLELDGSWTREVPVVATHDADGRPWARAIAAAWNLNYWPGGSTILVVFLDDDDGRRSSVQLQTEHAAELMCRLGLTSPSEAEIEDAIRRCKAALAESSAAKKED